jgi:hypothetical protein
MIDLSAVEENRLSVAVSTATQPFGISSPRVETEVLSGPDGSSLHVKVTLGQPLTEDDRFSLSRAVTHAALQALPELASVPLVTLLAQR